jgi:hypothetical protein
MIVRLEFNPRAYNSNEHEEYSKSPPVSVAGPAMQ